MKDQQQLDSKAASGQSRRWTLWLMIRMMMLLVMTWACGDDGLGPSGQLLDA